MIEVTPLDLIGQGALLEPINRELHDKAVAFCLRELADGKNVNFSKLAKAWVGSKDGEVLGVCGYVLRADIPLFRAIDADVLRAMGKRMNDFFCDNGMRGQQVLMYVGNEQPEQRCPQWREGLKEFGAKSGQRVIFEVR